MANSRLMETKEEPRREQLPGKQRLCALSCSFHHPSTFPPAVPRALFPGINQPRCTSRQIHDLLLQRLHRVAGLIKCREPEEVGAGRYRLTRHASSVPHCLIRTCSQPVNCLVPNLPPLAIDQRQHHAADSHIRHGITHSHPSLERIGVGVEQRERQATSLEHDILPIVGIAHGNVAVLAPPGRNRDTDLPVSRCNCLA